MPFPMETGRLILRNFQDADLEEFHRYRSDPIVAQFQGWDVPYSLDEAREFLNEMKNAEPAMPGKWFQAAIHLKTNGILLGDCAFHVMSSDNRQAYIGITIAREYWKNGYGEEACSCLLNYLFNELNLHRVVAECDVDNTASNALCRRLGFRQEAHLLENIWFKGDWGSEFHYAMLDREWKGRKNR
jgi:RimJ/RimL family protein N-acetyltransferase